MSYRDVEAEDKQMGGSDCLRLTGVSQNNSKAGYLAYSYCLRSDQGEQMGSWKTDE